MYSVGNHLYSIFIRSQSSRDDLFSVALAQGAWSLNYTNYFPLAIHLSISLICTVQPPRLLTIISVAINIAWCFLFFFSVFFLASLLLSPRSPPIPTRAELGVFSFFKLFLCALLLFGRQNL